MVHFRLNVLLIVVAEAFLSGPGASAFKTHGPRDNDLSGTISDPIAMLALHWGTSYFHVEGTRDGDGSLLFTLSDVVEEIIDRKPELVEENQCAAIGMKIRGAESSRFLTMTEVGSADDCQQLCRGALECKAAVFDAGALTCELLKSLDGLINSRGSTVVLPTCDHDCFRKGQTFTGNGTTIGFAPNASMCQALCASAAGCHAFTWNSATHACLSFPQDNDVNEGSHAVSGPKASCHARLPTAEYQGSCQVERASGWAKADLALHSNVDSYEACRMLCLQNRSCKWLTYNKKNLKCHLKPARGVLEYIAQADVTGPRNCDGKCFQRDVQLVGSPLKTIESVLSAHFCHFECSDLDACGMWSFDEATKKCYLHAQSTSIRGRRSAGYWTGGRNACGVDALYDIVARPCAVRGVRYRGEPLLVTNVPDAQECQYRCQASPKCLAFAFDTLLGKCELFHADAESKSETNLDYISGSRWCLLACMRVNTEGTGTVVQQFPSGFEVRERCQLRCQATAGCTFFSFYGPSGGCKLFSSNSTRVTSAVTSAGVECGNL